MDADRGEPLSLRGWFSFWNGMKSELQALYYVLGKMELRKQLWWRPKMELLRGGLWPVVEQHYVRGGTTYQWQIGKSQL